VRPDAVLGRLGLDDPALHGLEPAIQPPQSKRPTEPTHADAHQAGAAAGL
jgi:hypothetical protein